MGISTAWADSAATTTGGAGTLPAAGPFDAYMMFLPYIMIGVIFYLLLIRPQQQKVKEHQKLLSALRRGDKVVTAGGLIGTVARIAPDESEVSVEIARACACAWFARPSPPFSPRLNR